MQVKLQAQDRSIPLLADTCGGASLLRNHVTVTQMAEIEEYHIPLPRMPYTEAVSRLWILPSDYLTQFLSHLLPLAFSSYYFIIWWKFVMDYPLDSSIPGPVRPVLPTASQQFRMVLALLSRLPLIILTALRHLLGHSAPSHYLSMRAELAVAVIRTFIRHTPPQTLSEAQRDSLLDLGIPPRIWVSTYSWSGPPERSICDALIDGIRNLRISNDQLNFRLPKLARCEADWIGYRTMTDPKEPMPELSQQERFQAMMKECTKPTTILYLHGGSFYLGDPATIRPIAKKLAKITGGRCFAVRYRLAPQNPFPAALLDTLVAYFSLLYPPPDAYHEPVHPEHLVIAGDRYYPD